MKKKDAIYLSITLAILLGIIFVLLGKSSSGSKASSQKIEVVDPIDSHYNPATLTRLNDETALRDFTVKADFSGLGNTNLFGQ